MTIQAAIEEAVSLMTGDLDTTPEKLANAVRNLEIHQIAESDLVGRQHDKIPTGVNVIGFLRTLDVSHVQRSYEEKLDRAFAKHNFTLRQIGRSTKKTTTFAVIAA